MRYRLHYHSLHQRSELPGKICSLEFKPVIFRAGQNVKCNISIRYASLLPVTEISLFIVFCLTFILYFCIVPICSMTRLSSSILASSRWHPFVNFGNFLKITETRIHSLKGCAGLPCHCLFSSSVKIYSCLGANLRAFSKIKCPAMPTCPPITDFSPSFVLPEIPVCAATTVCAPTSTLCAI